jgi:hypothetical protein
LQFAAKVKTGVLGVGLLSADQTRWLDSGRAEDGAVKLEAMTGQDHAFRVVVFAAAPGALDAELNLTEATVVSEEIGDDEISIATAVISETSNGDAAPASEAPAESDAAEPASVRLISIDQPGDRKRRVFCHKPWSDLHNFSVDGRMDVCCIATGPSQERYALGNLSAQNFQDVWNGDAARMFRRTVNSDKVLPPCARCPMGYSYQGMWFDKNHTLAKIEGWVWEQKVFQLPILRRLPRYFLPLMLKVIDYLAFGRFREGKPERSRGQ